MTAKEFHDQLIQLVRAAEANGVGVEGGWVCQTNGDDAAWDIEIIEVARNR